MTGEGGDPEGNEKENRPADRPDRTEVIYGVASLTTPLGRLRRPVPPSSLRSWGDKLR